MPLLPKKVKVLKPLKQMNQSKKILSRQKNQKVSDLEFRLRGLPDGMVPLETRCLNTSPYQQEQMLNTQKSDPMIIQQNGNTIEENLKLALNLYGDQYSDMNLLQLLSLGKSNLLNFTAKSQTSHNIMTSTGRTNETNQIP